MGILQARILEWVAMPSSRGYSQPRDQTQILQMQNLHCRQILYHLSHQGSSRILEWAAYPFSRGTSWVRNRTGLLHCRWILYQLSYPGSPGIRLYMAEISSKCLRFHNLEEVLHRMTCCSPEVELNVWFCLTVISGKEKFFKNFNTIRWIRRQRCSLAAGSPCIAQEIEASCI